MPRTAVVVRVEGALDRGAARALLAAFLRGLSDVTLDFTNARDIDDAALSVLAGASARAVTMVGLSRHHERLLLYLGVPQTRGALTRS